MRRRPSPWPAAVAALAAIGFAPAAHAWGNSGHRMVASLAAGALPPQIPAFLRTPQAAAELGELSREPDRSRGAGKVHDTLRDPDHFIDIDSDGRVFGGPAYDALPTTVADYDSALRAAGSDGAKAGYLPYVIIDGWQQLVKDFALWRVADYGVRTERDGRRRAWLLADRASRQRLIVRDLGVWSYFVGDASYPLHVSSHFNGWGDGPNPQGYTTARIHVPIEGPFVGRWVKAPLVKAKMAAYRDCGCPIDRRVTAYLGDGWRLVEPFYALDKAGGFRAGDPRGVDFLAARLAAAASELRDLTVDAWTASEAMSVGYPIVTLSDVKAGRISAYDVLYSTSD